MTALRELLADFGFRVDARQLARADGLLETVIGNVERFGQSLLTGAAVYGVARFVRSQVELGSELHDTAIATGLSATELVEWRHAAGLSGVDAEQLTAALARTAQGAARGNPAIRRLGVATRTASGEMRSAGDIFEDVGGAIMNIADETERGAVAQEIWGRSGRRILPVFADGAEGVRTLREEVRRLYGGDLESLAAQADELGDVQDRLGLIWDAMSTRIALALFPALLSVAEVAIDVSNGFADLLRHSQLAQATLVTLGAIAVAVAIATVGAWGPPLVSFLLIATGLAFVAAMFGVVVVAVEDLIVMLQGGQSVLGEFLDELFGAGTAATVAQTVNDAWRAVLQTFGEVADAAHEMWSLITSDSPTVADGELRATSRGLDPATAVGGDELARREAIRRAYQGEHQDQAALRQLFGRGGQSVSAPVPASTSVTTTRSIGAIYVDGATDPVETARVIRAHLDDDDDATIDSAARDLLPTSASLGLRGGR